MRIRSAHVIAVIAACTTLLSELPCFSLPPTLGSCRGAAVSRAWFDADEAAESRGSCESEEREERDEDVESGLDALACAVAAGGLDPAAGEAVTVLNPSRPACWRGHGPSIRGPPARG